MKEPCEAWLEAISSYVDGALSSSEEQRVHAHMRECAGCSEYLVDLLPVVQALHNLPDPQPVGDAWPAIAFALRREGLYTTSFWKRLPRPAVGWAAAAVLVLAGGSVAAINLHQAANTPVADVDMYWHQHEIYSHDDGVPSLYAPEFNAIEASYRLDN
jgi:anti-sigma factor RsiW